MTSGRQLVREWLDRLDRELAAKAARAATSRHPTMTGDHREDVFREALREFLPPLLQVGKGRVFSSDGQLSKQTDVVIHDGRYPVFRQGDSALFPIESVLAVIEVKSTLDAAQLQDSWGKCLSVSGLRTCIAGEDEALLDQRLEAKGIGVGERREIVESYIQPQTYIFAFDGFATLEGFTDAFGTIPTAVGIAVSPQTNVPVVPSVVVSGGGVVSLAWGDPIRVIPAPEAPPVPPGSRPIYVNVYSLHGFGLLAAHLLWTIEKRTTLGEMRMGIRRSIVEYLPFKEYLAIPVSGRYSVSLLPDDMK